MERLKKIGKVKTFSSSEIKFSRMGIGFEKLDRNVFDPEKAYDKVAATGAKFVRIQSGWERTEKEKGVYDFAWLDSIVDNLVRRGMVPWMCLCYGNGIYDEYAKGFFGAVGCEPRTEEAKDAWVKYVKATVARYKGKVASYEVWNEPDGVWCWKHGVNGRQYGEFVILTAKAVKEADKDAKVIFGSQCMFSLEWLDDVLTTGAADYCDAYTYHNYVADESKLPPSVQATKALIHDYNPNIKIIQGETGCPSRSDGAGAMHSGAWTELRQAKFMARHTVTDFISDVEFCSYFSCMDMVEALNGRTGDLASYKDFGYFGILSASFDENGMATGVYTPKPSYYTFRTLASVFREEFSLAELPVMISTFTRPSPRLLGIREMEPGKFMRAGFKRPNGAKAFAYWHPADLLTTAWESTITIESAVKGTPRLVDLLDGSIYEFPENMMERSTPAKYVDADGKLGFIPAEETYNEKSSFIRFLNIPAKDYPLLLTFGDFVEMEEI
ncbi:MAG: beta-galactosidase [Lentisphaeria bacterium]|nr:beta-galactosidase [Lentisphaeria bacterium]